MKAKTKKNPVVTESEPTPVVNTVQRNELGQVIGGVLNPVGGNTKASSFRDSIMKWANYRVGTIKIQDQLIPVTAQERVAFALTEQAMKGRVDAIKEYGDRLDGKVKNTVEGEFKFKFSFQRDDYKPKPREI
jgi:hypothetical protein